MAGLVRILKLYGQMDVSANGKTVHWLWDYAKNEPVTSDEMPFGSERHKASERARWNAAKQEPTNG